MQNERQSTDVDQEVVSGEGRALADAPDRAEALGVDLEQPVVPADPLREPAPQRPRSLSAHHEASVVINALALTEEDCGILEVLRVHRKRVFLQGTPQGIAPVDRDTGGDAVVGQALAPDAEGECVLEGLKT